MTPIVVYTTGSGCQQCRMTKTLMDAAGIEYRDVDLTDPANAEARDYVTDDLGYSSAPVIVVDDQDHWTGFRPDKIAALRDRLAATREVETHVSRLHTTPTYGDAMASIPTRTTTCGSDAGWAR